jgi:hypothetical protein
MAGVSATAPAVCVIAGADRLHRLHRKRRTVEDADDDQGDAKGQEDACRVQLEQGDVGEDEGNQRAEVAEGAGQFVQDVAVAWEHGSAGRFLRPGDHNQPSPATVRMRNSTTQGTGS